MNKFSFFFVSLALTAASSVAIGQSVADKTPSLNTTTRLVVKYREGMAKAQSQKAQEARVSALSKRAQKPLVQVKEMTGSTLVVELERAVPMAEARILALKIALDPAVAYAAPDVWVKPMSAPNDSLAMDQWQSTPLADSFGSARFFEAWSLAGRNRVTVAVIDTGSVSHSDLAGNEIAGYDFISDAAVAGDGGPRDADPSDVGDYCDAETPATSSSWHGLKAASQIAAIANNNSGIAGAAAYNATILQVRALGRCGGWMSDVADAIIWSVGGSVPGVPTNGTPARVVNLSLGSSAGSVCYPYMQDAVDFATSVRAVVVASAGNEGTDGLGAPASCDGVIAVGAHTQSGDLASYSNRNENIALTAPGGGACQANTGTCQSSAPLALSNAGQMVPAGELSGVSFVGTSAAAPQVAAAAALLIAVDDSLTPAQVRARLTATARRHSAGSFCEANPAKCGAGMLDARAAMESGEVLGLEIIGPRMASQGSTLVSLTGVYPKNESYNKFSWKQLAGSPVVLSGKDTLTVTFRTPPVAGPTLIFELAVSSTENNDIASTFKTVWVNNAIQFMPPSDIQGSAGVPLQKLLTARDLDGGNIRFIVLKGPPELFTEGSYLRWANPVQGTHDVILMATDYDPDGSGDSVHRYLTISVGAPGSSTESGGGSAGGGGGTPENSDSEGGSGSLTGGGALILAFAALAAANRRRIKH